MGISRHFDDHDPNARLDYTIRWMIWLDGDQITGSNWAAIADNPIGMIHDVASDTFTTGTATLWLVSGTPGTTYVFEDIIGTLQGRRTKEKIYVTVKDR